MFLKKIELQGFKSFPDLTEINFQQPITAIVGPNGCGKSNITDAIRWVLGEQSVKNMRGFSMSDVIFSGSKDRKALNSAYVTLVFNNEKHILDTSYQEVEVTRKIFRASGESEYYINKQPVRLKDVIELTLDSGLGKDSLAMISQGTISQFAESKPLERRALFEDAANVAKYKKRKIEALSKLAKTAENMDRSLDIIHEIEGQLAPLKKEKEEALRYAQLKKKLEAIEVSVLVWEATALYDQLKQIDETLLLLESDQQLAKQAIDVLENDLAENKRENNECQQLIDEKQQQLMGLINEISQLEAQKIQFSEKSKYVIESGSIQEKISHLQQLIYIAQEEVDDRNKRLTALKNDYQLAQEENLLLNRKMIDLSMTLQQKQQQLQTIQANIQKQQQLLERPFIANAGIQAILNHKQHLTGVYDVVSQCIQVVGGYELAIATALGGSQNNVVVENQASAKMAIDFLKRNAGGKATFIPLDKIKPRSIYRDDLVIAENTAGFLGLASQFVNSHAKFSILVQNLLGNVLITEDFESARLLSNRLQQRVKIVSLEGDLFHIGGNITGGKTKENQSLWLVKKEVEKYQSQFEKEQEHYQQLKSEEAAMTRQKSEIDQNILTLRLNMAQLEPILEVKSAKLQQLEHELKHLDPHHSQGENKEIIEAEFIAALNQKYQLRDEINAALSVLRTFNINLREAINKLEIQLKTQRQSYNQISQQINALTVSKTKYDTKLDHTLNRLGSEYKMTYDYAKERVTAIDMAVAHDEVSHLRTQIQQIGNINMNAPQQYDELALRYQELSKQFNDLKEAKEKLLQFIQEMDDIMVKQLKETLTAINVEFDVVFKQLFGGGSAALVLDNPDDLLTTGIDIDVLPPGKSIQNIRLFSGGEKALIAISLLFAIIRVKQLPLCIFDEIEAALDQANVSRFAEYINQYRDSTQFILVTHRSGTMEKADILYGVTMAKQGVSSLLKVQFKDAKQLVERNS